MVRRKLELFVSYNGRNFFGFYHVYGMRTVQSELERVLCCILGEKADIKAIQGIVPGCSVRIMPVYFETSSMIQAEEIKERCNLMLEQDIRICFVREADHGYPVLTRKTIKEYEYHLMNYPLPAAIQGMCGCLVQKRLDMAAMQEAAYLLIGENDFTSFTTGEYEDPYRTIFSAEVEKNGSNIVVRMSGTGFLMNMVQMLTGELVRIGKGELTPDDLIRRFAMRCPDPDAPEMPAAGLILTRVTPVSRVEDLIHNFNDFADYYIIQSELKRHGRIFVLMMRCADEAFERLVKHILRLSYMDGAREVFLMDVRGDRLCEGETIGLYQPKEACGIAGPDELLEFGISGRWYLMERQAPV